MEGKIAKDSGVLVVARRGGTVISVSGEHIVVDPGGKKETLDDYSDYEGMDSYTLLKFKRSNQDTCVNQKPLVKVGEKIKAGQVLADGPATEHGELALGMNVVVAFMPWLGYNYEDAIVVSERFLKDDYFTSLHIEEFECQVRDTKAGMEEITREIPNVGEESSQEPRRGRHRAHRCPRQSRRHSGRQGDAQGRNRALSRRAPVARHLRREGRRRARRVA